MKKIMALLLAFAMVFSMAACGSADQPGSSTPGTDAPASPSAPDDGTSIPLDGSWPEKTIKIGIVNMDVTTPTWALTKRYTDYISEHFNIEFIHSESIDAVEDELAFIETCAASGCHGIIGWRNVSGAEAVKLASQLGMYYWLSSHDDAVIAACEDDPYFIGYQDAGTDLDYQTGYDWAIGLAEAGCKRVCYMAGGRDYGVPIFIDRSNGFYAGIADAQAEGYDIEVVYEINGWPGSDPYSAAQTAALDEGIDGIGDSVSVQYWIQPLNYAGKLDGSIKVATNVDLGADVADIYDLGAIAAGTHAETILHYIGPAIPLIVNAVNGHTELVRTADGKPVTVQSPKWIITDADMFRTLTEFDETGEFFLPAEVMATFFPELNENATMESYQETFGSFDVERALEIATGK